MERPGHSSGCICCFVYIFLKIIEETDGINSSTGASCGHLISPVFPFSVRHPSVIPSLSPFVIPPLSLLYTIGHKAVWQRFVKKRAMGCKLWIFSYLLGIIT